MRRGASSALRALGLLIAVVLVLGQTSSVSAIGTARISGNVTDTQGLPAPDVDVRAYVAVGDAWLPFAMTSTDAQGDYALAALDAASYAVEFADPQGALVSEWWDDTVGPTPVDLVVVGEGASIEGIDAALAAPGRITGVVTEEATGDGVETASVSAYALEAGSWEPTPYSVGTEADGSFHLGGLPAGTYCLEFYDFAGEYAPEFFDDQSTVDAGIDIVVAAGATVSGIQAALAGAGHISGRVFDTGDAGVPEVAVTAMGRIAGQWVPIADSVTDASGDYDVPGLTSGDYRVQFRELSGSYPVQFYDRQATVENGADVAVSSGATTSRIDAYLGAPVPSPTPTPTPTATPPPPTPTTGPAPLPKVDRIARPKIKGALKVGRRVRATKGVWSPRQVQVRYQWFVEGKKLRGATSHRLRLKGRWRGDRLTVKVTASASDHRPRSWRAKWTRPIRKAAAQ